MTQTLTLISWQTHELPDGSFVFQVYSLGVGDRRTVLIQGERPTRSQAVGAAKRAWNAERAAANAAAVTS